MDILIVLQSAQLSIILSELACKRLHLSDFPKAPEGLLLSDEWKNASPLQRCQLLEEQYNTHFLFAPHEQREAVEPLRRKWLHVLNQDLHNMKLLSEVN